MAILYGIYVYQLSVNHIEDCPQQTSHDAGRSLIIIPYVLVYRAREPQGIPPHLLTCPVLSQAAGLFVLVKDYLGRHLRILQSNSKKQ